MYTRLIITNDETAAEFLSICPLNGSDAPTEAAWFKNYINDVMQGTRAASFAFASGATAATATLTVSSTGSSNDETCSIAGVTFTAKTSGATGNQFNISTTPATQASNMATAFAASSDLAGIVTAEANGAVVTITSLVPGLIGNGLQISESLTNVALSDFLTEDTADDGTEVTLNLNYT